MIYTGIVMTGKKGSRYRPKREYNAIIYQSNTVAHSELFVSEDDSQAIFCN